MVGPRVSRWQTFILLALRLSSDLSLHGVVRARLPILTDAATPVGKHVQPVSHGRRPEQCAGDRVARLEAKRSIQPVRRQVEEACISLRSNGDVYRV
ncbi:hypothetical protein BD310DRAFT_935508 [Dichomitus squalens]|uniref:Secreted protein n=1 Tax=Dichomitus squalens TaxID=114155 RepID=A0A4Q9PKA7_9APHY|nr:hypothetical protein BD310DRAFT_935508 [Dichomitus squalens]